MLTTQTRVPRIGCWYSQLGNCSLRLAFNIYALYTPNGAPNSAWQPVITSIKGNGDGTFTLTGTQLNGISEGASSHGAVAEMATNFPLVRFVYDGVTSYGRTFNWSDTGVQAGNISESVEFALPAGLNPLDLPYSQISVVANGIASTPINFELSSPYFGISTDLGTVTAYSTNDVPLTTYTGTVYFTSTDPQAVLPAPYTFTTADHGVHDFGFANDLHTAGEQTVTVTDTLFAPLFAPVSGMAGTSPPLSVSPGPASKFVIVVPTPAVNEVQMLSFGGTVTGGTFTLALNGQATAPIPFSIAPATLAASTQNALDSLSSLGAANAVQQISFAGFTGSSFILEFMGHVTTAIAYSTDSLTLQSNIQSALNTFSTVMDGSDTTNAAVSASSATSVNVAFQNALGGRPLPNISSFSSQVTVTTTTAGKPAAGNVSVAAINSTSLAVTFTGTLAGASVALLSASNTPVDTVQTIYFPGPSTGGTFTLNYGGVITSPIIFSSVIGTLKADIQSALDDLPTIGQGNTQVGLPVQSAGVTTVPISFTNTLAGGVPTGMLTVNEGDLTGGDSVGAVITTTDGVGLSGASPMVNTVETLNFGGSITSGSTSSTFTLAYDGASTSPIEYSSNSGTLRSNIQSALNGVSTIGSGNTHVYAASASVATITFQNALAGEAVQGPLALTSTLTGTGATVSLATTTYGLGVSGNSTAGAMITTAGYAGAYNVTTEEPFNGTVIAEDQYGNVTSSPGPIFVTTSQGSISNNTLTSGAGTFVPTLVGLPSPSNETTTLTATYSTNQSPPVNISGSLTAVTIVGVAANHLVLTVPTTAQAGALNTFTVTAEDSANGVAQGYDGTVQISSSDPKASLQANVTFRSGVGIFSATLETAGAETLTATGTDVIGNTISSTATTITVVPASVASFALGGLSSSYTAGGAVTGTITAVDAFGNTVTSDTDTVHITSSDSHASQAANVTLALGVGTFSITLKTAALESITATDASNAGITGSSSVNVVAGPATQTGNERTARAWR